MKDVSVCGVSLGMQPEQVGAVMGPPEALREEGRVWLFEGGRLVAGLLQPLPRRVDFGPTGNNSLGGVGPD